MLVDPINMWVEKYKVGPKSTIAPQFW